MDTVEKAGRQTARLKVGMTEPKSTWGGKRKGAGSGGPRPGAGRPQSTITIRLGDRLLISRRDDDGATPSEMATVAKIERGTVTLQTDEGDVITLVR